MDGATGEWALACGGPVLPLQQNESAMSLQAHLSAQLDAELDASRRVIERIPESMLGWKPHEKSWSTKELATHIANLISWGAMILSTRELDFEADEMKNWAPPKADDVPQILKLLQDHGDQVRSILSDLSDEDLALEWVMRSGDQVFSNDPRHFAFARWVLAHQSHHRGQLMVYLRLNDVALPGIFGPTADETEM